MLLHRITLIHLNFFKFKHKNERIKARKITLIFGWKRLGFGLVEGTGLGTPKSGVGWFLHQSLCTFSLCSPSSKTDWSHQNSTENWLLPLLHTKPVLALKFGANLLLQNFWNFLVKLRLMAANLRIRDEKFQFGNTREARIWEGRVKKIFSIT